MLSLIREQPSWYSWLVGALILKSISLLFFFLASSEFLQLCVPSWCKVFGNKVG